MKQVEKLPYLDGLKVLACLMIYNFHFINFFYPGEYSLLPEHFHTVNLEYIFGSTPLNIIAGGKFGVRTFMTLSGFLVGYRFFVTGERKSLTTGVIKKYFRLILPIVFANIVIFICMKAGLYYNAKASVLAGSEVFVGNYNTFEPHFLPALKEALFGCFVTGENQYNGPLWFIYYEFWGTALIAAIISLLGDTRARYAAYAVGAIILIRTDFLPFILGTVVCDLTYRPPIFVEKLTKQKWLMGLLLLFGLFLGSFPPIGERMEGTIYQPFPLKIILFYNIGSSAVLFAVLHLKTAQKVLGNSLFTWYNQYTYGFYLIHFMILCTFSCGIFTVWYGRMNYHVLCLINFSVTLVLTTVASYLIHRFIELPGIRLSGKIGAYFEKQ
ncbi:MAG TPA: hypothetical protein DCG85_02995 [Lachnospiraceae bacterium]|nr:hypothetical protein [Lachnospiraceae bacterium]